MEFNKEQNTVINLTKGKHLVLAPPGTGKTDVLTYRVINAIENGVNPENMICLTFTNRAAKEMQLRVKEKIGETTVFIGNIHNFCSKFLKDNLITNNSTVLLDDGDQDIIVEKALKIAKYRYRLSKCKDWKNKVLQNLQVFFHSKYSVNYKIFDQLRTLKNVKEFDSIRNDELKLYELFLEIESNMDFHNPFLELDVNEEHVLYIIKPQTLSSYFNYFKNKICYQINENLFSFPKMDFDLKSNCLYEIAEISFEIYQEELLKINALDFDDLIASTYSVLKSEKYIHKKYSWLQVDESQDLNPLQWSIIELLKEKECLEIFFGDYEQSIYSFIGADIDYLKKLEDTHLKHYFNINYRSPQYLLDVYSKYSDSNFDPIWAVKTTSNSNEKPDRISLIYRCIYGYENDEMHFMVNNIIPNLPLNNTTAILVKFNKTADHLSYLLNKNEIVHFKISGFDIFRRVLIKVVFAVLNTLHNNLDRNAWFRIFFAFSNINTLTSSGYFVVDLFEKGFIPTDFVLNNKMFLEDFNIIYKTKRIIVFDTETTGLDTKNDDIIQIAAIEIINGVIGKTFEVYIETSKDLGESVKIHKITSEDLKIKGQNRKKSLNEFLNFVGSDTLVAHNLKYDYNILMSNLEREDIEINKKICFYDSIDLTKRIHSKLPSYKLEYLISYFNLEGVNSHNALDDVKATANLIMFLFSDISHLLTVRNEFLIKNKITLEKFEINFKPLFIEHFNKLDQITNLSDKFNLIAEYCISNLKLEKPENYDKIVRYFNEKIREDSYRNILENNLDDLNKFKESDIVIGDERLMISTIHKSKGLQFDNILIPNCVNGIYPYKGDIDEEIRLFYVALTRAKKRIIISSFVKGKAWSEKIFDKPGDLYPKKVIHHPYSIINHSSFLEPILDSFNCKVIYDYKDPNEDISQIWSNPFTN